MRCVTAWRRPPEVARQLACAPGHQCGRSRRGPHLHHARCGQRHEDHARRRVVHRQLPPDRRADPDGPAAPAARATTASCRGWPTRLAGGMPRVYDIALELISHAHGRVDVEGLRAFVAAYQAVKPLRLGELWAIPIMLRLALLENLRRVVAARDRGADATASAPRTGSSGCSRSPRRSPARVVLGARRDGRGESAADERVRRRAREPPAGARARRWCSRSRGSSSASPSTARPSSTCSSWPARARRPTRSRSATASAACASWARPTGATSSRR